MPSSARSQLLRMEHDAEEAFQCYHQIETHMAPALRVREGGPALIKHSSGEKVALFRLKANLRSMRLDLKQEGWFREHILSRVKPPAIGANMRRIEVRIRHFVGDSMNTSLQASRVLKKVPVDASPGLRDTTDDSALLCAIANALMKIAEQRGSEADADFEEV